MIRLLPAGATVGAAVEGPTAGGQLLEIYGDGFRLPNTDPVPLTPGKPFVVADRLRSVSVKFDGVEATAVEVVRTNLVRVITPPSPIPPLEASNYGAGAVDVVIQNLDDNEDPIGGETVTVTDGYIYRRVKFDATVESDFVRLVRTLIRMWKVQVLPNVVMTQNTDWDADISSASVDIGQTPAIVLVGPRTPENRFYSVNETLDELIGDDVQVRRKPQTVDVIFDVVGISDNPIEAMNIMTVAAEFVDRNPYLFMDRDPADVAKGRVRYEFDFLEGSGGGFAMVGGPNASNLHTFSGSIVVRGFDIEGFQGFAADHLVGLSEKLGDQGVSLDVGTLVG